MLAGVTRIIEICFIVPRNEPESEPEVELINRDVQPPLTATSDDSDNQSEYTLGGLGSAEREGDIVGTFGPKVAAVHAFRHLPPFVSSWSGCV